MKKSVLFLAVLFFFLNYSYSQLKMEFEVGPNYSNIKITLKTVSTVFSLGTHHGYNCGGVLEYSFNHRFSLRSGIFVSSKGYYYSIINASDTGFYFHDEKLHSLYLEAPLNAMLELGRGKAKFLVFGGPYFAYGIGGTFETETEPNNAPGDKKRKIIWGTTARSSTGSADHLKQFDMGMKGGIGVRSGRLYATVQYEYGMLNISTNKDVSVKNICTSISLGYMLLE